MSLLFPVVQAAGQAGALDSTFNGNGKIITRITGVKKNLFLIGSASAVAMQTDGKIVVAGQGSTGTGPGANFMAVRYKPNGKQDSSFGTNGQVNIPQFRTREDFDGVYCNGVALQANGEIVLAGDVPGYYYNSFEMVRYTPAGAVAGAFTTAFYSSDDDHEHSKAVAIQADGKIVQAGDITNETFLGLSKFALTRYLADGTKDSSFGINSKVITKVGAVTENSGNALAIQPDGKILLAGTVYQHAQQADYPEDSGDVTVLRYKPDGTLDSTFGINGVVVTDLNGNDEGNAVVLQASGKIVVAGTTNAAGTEDFAMIRYTGDGKIDSTFGLNGAVISNLGGNDTGSSVALQHDQKIIVAGTSNASGKANFTVVRYTKDGTPDSSFGTNGIAMVDFGGDATQHGLTIQADGGIVVVGNYQFKFAVARFKGDSTDILPVNIINLKAYLQGGAVKLSWTALNELNVASYIIQRSANGKDFTAIGNVKAAGNRRPVIDYSFVDGLPFKGDNFYYLQATDRDGKKTQTGVVLIDIKNDAFIVYPNPAKDVVRIDGLQATDTKTISLVDAAGKVLQRAVTQNTGYSFNVKQLAAGLYYIRINSNNNLTTLRFIKQ